MRKVCVKPRSARWSAPPRHPRQTHRVAETGDRGPADLSGAPQAPSGRELLCGLVMERHARSPRLSPSVNDGDVGDKAADKRHQVRSRRQPEHKGTGGAQRGVPIRHRQGPSRRREAQHPRTGRAHGTQSDAEHQSCRRSGWSKVAADHARRVSDFPGPPVKEPLLVVTPGSPPSSLKLRRAATAEPRRSLGVDGTGRSSIPEASALEPRSRSVLTPRIRGR